MGNRLRARIVNIHGIEIFGVTSRTQTLVLSLQLNNTQNVIDNIGCRGNNANVLARAVADAP